MDYGPQGNYLVGQRQRFALGLLEYFGSPFALFDLGLGGGI